MRWTIHGERALYRSDWVNLHLVDVELPDGTRFDHHVVRMPLPAAGVVVHDAQRGVLLLWRHRFIADQWGWEIPGGRVEPGESMADAAAREALEETGWRPGPLTELVRFLPTSGLSDQWFNVFLADGAEHVGEPEDAHEAERIEWLPVERVRHELATGGIVDGMSVGGLGAAFARGLL